MSLKDRLLRDKDGKLVIGQKPNLPIIAWFAAYMLQASPFLESFDKELSVVATVSLYVWALLELLRGVNLFRRILGGIVIVALTIPLIAWAI